MFYNQDQNKYLYILSTISAYHAKCASTSSLKLYRLKSRLDSFYLLFHYHSTTTMYMIKSVHFKKTFTLVYRIDVHARLLILRKKSLLYDLILVCTFINSEEQYPQVRNSTTHLTSSLNTQSCIKGLLVVWDFCFWAVWAAGPVHTQKKLGADYE